MSINNRRIENTIRYDINFRRSLTHYIKLNRDSNTFFIFKYRISLVIEISLSNIVYILFPHTVGKLYKRYWRLLNNPFYYTIPPLQRNSKPLLIFITLGASIIPQKLILSISTLYFDLLEQPHLYDIGYWSIF